MLYNNLLKGLNENKIIKNLEKVENTTRSAFKVITFGNFYFVNQQAITSL